MDKLCRITAEHTAEVKGELQRAKPDIMGKREEYPYPEIRQLCTEKSPMPTKMRQCQQLMQDYFQKEGQPYENLVIVVSGPALSCILGHADLSEEFFRCCLFARSIICTRAAPSQKKGIIGLAKLFGTWRTLAVGDGANDVPMIMEAHIGVGIVGREGNQAVLSSDFAIPQFQFLVPLILWHGRVSYRKVSIFICYYFYKNIILVLTELAFAFMNGYSGQIYFADWLPMLYNIFWTSLPPIFTYIFEQDIKPLEALQHPELYSLGQDKVYFNFTTFWKWILWAIVHGMLCFFIPVYVPPLRRVGYGGRLGLCWTR